MTSKWKLCIIDDIEAVTEGISKSAQWHELGIQVAGTATDGKEGLRLIDETLPDIVITDIRMPKMDGLILTERIKLRHPGCKIIFITGYTDFEYAQKALKLGAFDFIAKPFSLEEIVAAVLKAKQALEEERHDAHKRQELEQKVKTSLPMLRQEFLQLLLHHRGEEEKVRSRWEFLHIPLNRDNLAVMVLEIDSFEEQCLNLPIQEVELLRFALQNIVEETISTYTRGIVFRETMGRFIAIFNEVAETSNLAIAELCCQHIDRYTKFTVSIGLGLSVKRMHEVANSYNQAISALTYHFYTGGNGVFGYREGPDDEVSRTFCSNMTERELLYSIRSGNAERASAVLADNFAEFVCSEEMPEPEYYISLYHELAYKMIRVLLEIVSQDEAVDVVRSVRGLSMSGAHTMRKLHEQLQQISEQCCNLIMRTRASEASSIIEESVRYVQSHLDKELSVQNSAELVHLSGSYFAKLFKKKMGMSFMLYVTQERMELAKTMLLDGHQVQEIAYATGYGDRRYFSDAFKKHTGVTPSEFKAKYKVG